MERDALGGICNNWGCIPTKALLAGAELYQSLKHDAADWGITVEGLGHDWAKVIERSRGIASLGATGVAALFKKNKVTHVQGVAQVTSGGPKCKVEVRGGGDGKAGRDSGGEVTHTIECKHVVLATGARPRQLPGVDFDGDKIISYKEAMSLPEQPKELVVVGAGAIGMEFRLLLQRLRDEGDGGGDAGSPAADRGRRGVQGGGAVVQEAGHHLPDGHEDDGCAHDRRGRGSWTSCR